MKAAKIISFDAHCVFQLTHIVFTVTFMNSFLQISWTNGFLLALLFSLLSFFVPIFVFVALVLLNVFNLFFFLFIAVYLQNFPLIAVQPSG